MATTPRAITTATTLGTLVDGHGAPTVLDIGGVTRMTSAAIKALALMEASNPTTRGDLRLFISRKGPLSSWPPLDGVVRSGNMAKPIRAPAPARERRKLRICTARAAAFRASGSPLATCTRASAREGRARFKSASETSACPIS